MLNQVKQNIKNFYFHYLSLIFLLALIYKESSISLELKSMILEIIDQHLLFIL